MAAGIAVDRNFLIRGKAASAQEVLNTLKPVVPSWFFKAFTAERGRLVLKDARLTDADRKDPDFGNWEQIYRSIRDASDAGEWRLLSAATADKASEGGPPSTALELDAAAAARPTRGGRALEPTISGEILGWTGVSQARELSIQKFHPGAVVADENWRPVDGNEGVAVISTRRTNASGAATDRNPSEIGLTILHELAAHAGLATGAGQSSKDDPDWTHHEVTDLGERPADAIERFLDRRRADLTAPLSAPAPTPAPARKGFFERFRLFHLRAPEFPGAGHGPAGPGPGSYQQQLLQQQQRQLQLQQQQLQNQLQRAAQNRMIAEQQMNRDQLLRQAQEQRSRDQARLQEMLRRQSEQQRQQAQQQAARRLAEDQQRREREQMDRQRLEQRAMRVSQVSSRPAVVYGAPAHKPFVSPKLWEPSRPNTMTLPPGRYTAPPRPSPPPPRPVSPPFSRPSLGGLYS